MGAIPMRILRRLAFAAISFVALGIVTFVQLDATTDDTGLDSWLVVTLAAIVALFGPGEIAFRALAEWFGQVSYEEHLNMEEPAKACVVGIAKITDIPITRVGVTVFVVLRSRYHPIRGIQKRVVRVRLESNPAPTTIDWTMDKGLLGECWTQRRDASRDHTKQFAKYMNCTEEEWMAVPDHVRQNLSYDDYLQIRQFGFVLATPMIDPTKARYRGCLVIQVPSEYGPSLATPDVLEFIRSSAALTCAVLR